MDRHLTDEEKEKIVNFGAFQYDAEEMAIILGWELKEVVSAMKTNGEYKQLYDKGAVVSDYLLEVKVFEMAKAGDLKAIEKFERAKRKRLG